MKLTITEGNFEYYLKIYAIFYKNLFGLIIQSDNRLKELADFDPLEKLQILKKENPKIAKLALKEGIRESLTMIDHYPPETRLQIERDLKEKGLGNLLELISLVKNIAANVLKNKKIKNLDEYYVIKEKLDDLTSGLSEKEREVLNKCLSDFELKNKKNNYTLSRKH